MEAAVKVFRALQRVGKLPQGLRHGGVDHHVGTGDGVARAHHAELELVACEGEGGGAVAVGGVPVETGQNIGSQPDAHFLHSGVRRVVLDGLKHRIELVAQEHGNHGGRSFVGAQTVVVARGRHAHAQQALIVVHRLDHGGQEQKELSVLVRGISGRQQVHARVGGHGPVVVLARAVDAGKGLFVQQTGQAVLPRHLFHDLHGKLVVIGGYVGGGVNGGQLMLGRSDLVVLGLGQDPQLPQLLVQILHIGLDPGLDGAEIVVVQLLPLGRHGAEQSPAGIYQVLAFEVHLPIHQEIFLFRSHAGNDALDILAAEQAKDPHGLGVERFHRPQQRRLFVQRFSAVGAEGRGDAERVFLYEGITGGVPGGVAPGLKGGPQAARGEAGGVRLTLDQLFPGKLHDHAPVGSRTDESVVLFRRDARHGLEPVSKVGGSVFHGPGTHGLRYGVGYGKIQFFSVVNGLLQGSVDLRAQSGAHLAVVKDLAAKEFGYCHFCPLLFRDDMGG